MLRAAAEWEFAKSRLQALTINLYAYDKSEPMNRHYFFMNTQGLLQIDGDRAMFSALFPISNHEPQSDEDQLFVAELRHKALANSDIDYLLRNPYPRATSTYIEQNARLCTYYNQVPVPGADISLTNGTISLIWKPFVDNILGIHANARYVHGHRNSFADAENFFRNSYYSDNDSTPQWMSPMEKAGSCFHRKFESESHRSDLIQAYLARVRRAHTAAGVAFDLDEPLDEYATLITRTTRAYLLNHFFDMMRLYSNNALITEFNKRMAIRSEEAGQSLKSEDSTL